SRHSRRECNRLDAADAVAENPGELTAHVDAASFPVLWRADFAVRVGAPNREEAAREIDVTDLEPERFTEAQPRSGKQKEKRKPGRIEDRHCAAEEQCKLLAREELDFFASFSLARRQPLRGAGGGV